MRHLPTTLVLLTLAAAPSLAAANDDEDIEEVEAVETAPAGAAPSAPGFSDAVGRFHPVVVHFPIAWLLLMMMVELWALLRRSARELVTRVSPWLLVLTALSAIPAVVTGLLRAATNAAGAAPELQARIILHRNLGLATLGVVLVVLALRLVLGRRKGLSGAWRVVYLVALAGAAALVAVTGHLGGELVFGEGYLRSPLLSHGFIMPHAR